MAAAPTHEVHTSERKSFRGCRRRWAWIFRENFYPRITAKPLEFGVAYHKALEVAYDPERWGYPLDVRRDLAINAFVKKCEEQWENFQKTPESQMANYEEVREDYDERINLGIGMLKYHFKNIAPEMDKTFRPLAVEVRFQVPITNPDTGEQLYCERLDCSQHPGVRAPVTFDGRIDLLCEDKYGDWWVDDWKTTVRLSTDRDEFLDLDDQISGYVWAMTMLGKPVRGFLYHEQYKAFPVPPERLTRSYKGRWFSTNKNQATTYELAKKTFSEQDPQAYAEGLYDLYLTFLENEGRVFHERYQKHRSAGELLEIHRNLYLEAVDIVNPDLPLYPNPGRFSCSTCAFRQPCLEKNSGGDYQYALNTLFDKREHYWVRVEASTDTKGGE